MGATCQLVVLEAAATQEYVFDTGSHRESLGASHLAASLGSWTADALERAFEGWTKQSRIAAGAPAELLTTAGGGVTVLVEEFEQARSLVTEVTLRALGEAPGLDVCGVVAPFAWQDRDGGDGGATLAEAFRRARAMLPTVRADRMRPAHSRFARLPVVASCSSTGLPATALYDDVAPDREAPSGSTADRGGADRGGADRGGADRGEPDASGEPATAAAGSGALPAAGSGGGADPARASGPTTPARSERFLAPPRPRARTALAKLAALGGRAGAYHRLADQLWPGRDPDQTCDSLEAVTDYLEREADWVAVVHVNGNGLADLFRRLPEFLVGRGSAAYAAGLRQLSGAVDGAVQDATRAAVDELASLAPTTVRRPGSPADGLPVLLPLVIGGDDLTVVCDASSALSFAAVYLFAFEAATRRRFAAVPTSELTGLPDRVTAAAGVAIVRPDCPHADAFGLARDLVREAKTVKAFERGSSALSFHVLHDAEATTLAQVRARTTVTATQLVRLVAQPYVVDGPGTGRALGGVAGTTAWGARHRWSDLLARVDALRRLAPGSGQAHDLRDGLFAGPAVADARFDLVRYRYDAETLARLAPGGSLFWTDGATDGALTTGLLDAMDADAFLPAPAASAALDRSAAAFGSAAAAVAASPLVPR